MKVSVIVPAYNAERHLRSCIDSVRAQSYADWELVAVDDGSVDGTSQILAEASGRDGRIRVVRQQNAGVSAARNRGLAEATGDIVWFVDADDELHPDALAVSVADFNRYRPDCVVYGMSIEPPEAAPLTLSHRLVPREALYEGFDPAIIFEEYTHPYAFRVAFLRSFLCKHDLSFDTRLSLGEDEAFLFTAYRLSGRTLLVPLQLYRYRMDTASVSHRENESVDVLPTKLNKHLNLVSCVLEDWRRRGLDDSCDAQILVWALDLLLLDIARLDGRNQHLYHARLWSILADYFGDEFPRVTRAARACLNDMRIAAIGGTEGGNVVSRLHLIGFYLRSRGVGAVAERAAVALCGGGAYAR